MTFLPTGKKIISTLSNATGGGKIQTKKTINYPQEGRKGSLFTRSCRSVSRTSGGRKRKTRLRARKKVLHCKLERKKRFFHGKGKGGAGKKRGRENES